MGGFNFADKYKAAGLNPGPDIIRLRQDPFEKICKDIESSSVIDLTRLYFGMSTPNGTDWFRDAFAESDPSFTMLDNEREASVLSACLLEAVLRAGNACAGLAPLTAAAAGNRSPVVLPAFLEEARKCLHTMAIDARSRSEIQINNITLPAKSKFPAPAESLAQGANWPKVGELLNQVSEESWERTKTLANEVYRVIAQLVSEAADLREELDMLWWYVGGWSRVLERPFSELDPALATVMAGFDLACLTRGETGPAAVPAILQRLVSTHSKTRKSKFAIKEAVDPFPTESFQRMNVSDVLKGLADICPVLSAFRMASEVGESPAWHAMFRKASNLEVTAAFNLLDLAVQVYREARLITLLG